MLAEPNMLASFTQKYLHRVHTEGEKGTGNSFGNVS